MLIYEFFFFLDALAVDGFSCLAPTQVTENKNFDEDFVLCREEVHGKPEYVELMSGIPEEVSTVQEDLEISDSDEENRKIKDHDIDLMSENVITSSKAAAEMDDDDADGLWF